MHENRETSEMPEADHRDRPAGEGNSHTARVHVFEESEIRFTVSEPAQRNLRHCRRSHITPGYKLK